VHVTGTQNSHHRKSRKAVTWLAGAAAMCGLPGTIVRRTRFSIVDLHAYLGTGTQNRGTIVRVTEVWYPVPGTIQVLQPWRALFFHSERRTAVLIRARAACQINAMLLHVSKLFVLSLDAPGKLYMSGRSFS
jgi:hypothetical protein